MRKRIWISYNQVDYITYINRYNLSEDKVLELCSEMFNNYLLEYDTLKLRREIEYKTQFIIDNYIRESRENKIDQIINNRDRKINFILNGRN